MDQQVSKEMSRRQNLRAAARTLEIQKAKDKEKNAQAKVDQLTKDEEEQKKKVAHTRTTGPLLAYRCHGRWRSSHWKKRSYERRQHKRMQLLLLETSLPRLPEKHRTKQPDRPRE